MEPKEYRQRRIQQANARVEPGQQPQPTLVWISVLIAHPSQQQGANVNDASERDRLEPGDGRNEPGPDRQQGGPSDRRRREAVGARPQSKKAAREGCPVALARELRQRRVGWLERRQAQPRDCTRAKP